MNIYKGKHLSISYEKENSLFVQHWLITPKNITEFKAEILEYVSLYKKHKPKFTLWLQRDFSLILDKDDYGWIDQNVNKPCMHYGNLKCAFVVGKDVFAHVSVMNSFEEVKHEVNTKHFTSENDARAWIFDYESTENLKEKPKVVFDKIDENGDMLFKIKNIKDNVNEALLMFKDNLESQEFTNLNLNKFNKLSDREKQILKLIAEGKKYLEISEMLFISIHTARTHWRNVKSKLDITSEKDIQLYYRILKLENT